MLYENKEPTTIFSFHGFQFYLSCSFYRNFELDPWGRDKKKDRLSRTGLYLSKNNKTHLIRPEGQRTKLFWELLLLSEDCDCCWKLADMM